MEHPPRYRSVSLLLCVLNFFSVVPIIFCCELLCSSSSLVSHDSLDLGLFLFPSSQLLMLSFYIRPISSSLLTLLKNLLLFFGLQIHSRLMNPKHI